MSIGAGSADDARWWFEDYLEACNRHDLAAVRGLLDPDVRRAHLPRGADAWVDALAELFTAFPDYRWKRIALVVEDDRVAAHLRTRGTHRGRFADVEPTGRHVGTAEFVFVRVVSGRAVEFAGSDPAADLRAQLLA